MTDIATILERFDLGAEAVEADPEAFRRKVEEELIAEKGQEWFDENKHAIDNDWEAVRALIGI